MKKFLGFMMLVFSFFMFCACGKDNTVKIGFVGPLTGNLSVYGTSVKNALDLAIEEVNAKGGVLEKEIELVFEDTQGKGAEALTAYERIAGKIDLLIGEVTSGNTEIVAEAADEDKMPVLTATATALSITENRPTVFRACFIDPQQGTAMAIFTKDTLTTVKNVAVLYDNSDDYSKGVAESYIQKATSLGLNVVLNDGGLRADESDYTSLVTKTKNVNPDAVFAPVYYETAAVLIKQFRDASYTAPILGPDGFDGILNVPGVVAKNYDNVYFSNHYAVDSSEQNVKDFVANYTKKYGSAPNALAALAYDALYAAAAAIEKAGTTEKAKIVEALAKVEYKGVTGNIKFNETGNPTKSVVVVKYDNGVIKYVCNVELE